MNKKKYEKAPSNIAEAIQQAEVIADFLPGKKPCESH